MKKQIKLTNTIFSNIWHHPHFLPFILFTFIFTVYFSSSVGLINSGDTPQFFTTEALIKYQDIELEHFQDNPHYFVHPDVYTRNGKLFALRGVVFSYLMIPLHTFASYISGFFTTNNFPQNVISPNFKYELAITSLFTSFSVFGLYLIFLLQKELKAERWVEYINIISIAFGTYIWKYSSYYSRFSINICILGLTSYCFGFFLKRKKINWLIISLVWVVTAYGVDMILALALAIFFICFLAYYLIKKIFSPHQFIRIVFFPAVLLFIIMYLNYANYGNVLSNQSNQISIVKKYHMSSFDLFSTPIFPTIMSVLFGNGKIFPESFANLSAFNKEFNISISAEYAKKYNFYGIFTVSPFILFITPVFFMKKKIVKNIKILQMFIFSTFVLGVIINLKVVCFWGGNQYDIRYFYPYSLLLAVPLVFVLDNISTLRLKIARYLFWAFYIIALLFSFAMSWLGVINMYKPALTGERRIWMEIYDLPMKLTQYSLREYLDATFLNRENAWIAIAISIIGYFSFRIATYCIRSAIYFFKYKKER